MSKFTTIILAAGNGTRMKSSLPKVLHKVANKTMLAHVADTATAIGSEQNIIVASPHNIDALKNAVNGTYVVQDKALGTAHAVLSAKSKLNNYDGNILILYGDCPLIAAATEGFSDFFNLLENSDIAILGFQADDPYGYGRLITEGYKVIDIIEELDADDDQQQITLCNSGILYTKASLLFELLEQVDNNNAKQEYYLTDIVKIANQQGLSVDYAVAEEHLVLGVNDKLDLAIAEDAMQNSLRQKAMFNGVTIISPETTYLSADTVFGKDVILKPNVVIDQNVKIGDNVSVGPFAHLRPGTDLSNDSRIGNFVEVKNSSIGKNSKINHLSYIGDSEVGENVNIGAGTITCNYDGTNKHKTTIKNNVFVGSNTALVAPVTIGKNSTIAAGSTITENVEESSLAIARERQINKKKN